MARRRTKASPSDPTVSARLRAEERERARDPANWGLDREDLRLNANADVHTRADRAGTVVRARRQDVFDLMVARGRLSPAAFDALRQLQSDVARLHAMAGGVSAYSERIDRSGFDQSITDARRRSSDRIDAMLALAGPANARLLLAICESAAALGPSMNWRTLVERETGEHLADAQGAVLRAACENLAEALAMLRRRGRRSCS
jgi:hypothetical protein